MKKLIGKALIVFLVSASSPLFSQIGGNATYKFLNVTSSAKIAALGGYALAVEEGDLEQVYFNPSLLSESKSKDVSLSYVDYLSDINYGFASYAHKFKAPGTFAGSVKYIHYGNFIHADETGEILGEFTASETALILTWANKYKEYLSYGANLKFVYSNFFLYNSSGVLLDLSATFKDKSENFKAALVVRNVGSQITTYESGNYEPMPFEILLGTSYKLPHAPLRLSINAHNLQQGNIWYESPNNINTASVFASDSTSGDINYGDAIMRHITFGAEILLSKNFHLRAGYNHQRRQELKLKEGSKSGANGFSFGFGVQIKKFKFDFARSIYSLAGSSNHIGISTNFGTLLNRKSPDENDSKEGKP